MGRHLNNTQMARIGLTLKELPVYELQLRTAASQQNETAQH
jgi:hypothetical protein